MKFNKWNIGVVIVFVVFLGGLFLLFPKSKKQETAPTSAEQQVKKLSPEDIGLTLTVRPDKKGVIMKINKLNGISSIEYDVSYDAEVTDEGETNVVPRGVSGSPVTVKSGDTEISRNLDLGTCSRNVCKYDKVKSDVKFTIRVNYSNGQVGAVETSVSVM